MKWFVKPFPDFGWHSKPTKGLFDLFGELGKGRRGEGEKKDEEHLPADQLSIPIDGRLIVKRHGVPEPKEDHQDEHENPSRIVEDRDETHDSDGDGSDHLPQPLHTQ